MSSNSALKISEMPEETRPINRVNSVGADAASTIELLACLLQTGNAMEQANLIIKQFGSLENLSQASKHDLVKVPGIGPAQAAKLMAACELGRRALMAGVTEEKIQIQCPAKVGEFLRLYIGNKTRENFAVLHLNTRNEIVDQEILYIGTVNTSLVRIAEVFQHAVQRDSVAIIVGHNHPSGTTTPSPEDITLTRRLVDAGKLLEVDILDHIVVTRDSYYSMREHRQGFENA